MSAKGGKPAAGQPPGSGVLIGAWLGLIVVAAVSIAPLIAPQPPADPAPGEFSVDSAIEHVARIAERPHPIGSDANMAVRRYLVEELTALGLQPELQTITVVDYFGDPNNTVEVVNVMARIAGSDPTGAVALMAHYDSVPSTYGANDDGSGVAAILEAARVLVAGPGLSNDVILLFTDGEEPAPRFGSTAFLDEHPWAEDVGFVVNFEALGGSGPSLVVETNGSQLAIIRGLAAARPVAFSFLPETVRMIGGIGTDFDPFLAEGIPGIHLAYLEGSPIYHTFRDSLNRVGMGSLYHHGSYAVALARHFGDIDLSRLSGSEDVTFFTVGRWLVVRYPEGWVVPLALLVAALFGISVVRRVARRESSLRALLVGLGVVVVRIVLVVIVATLVWKGLTGLRQSPGAVESYLYLFGLLTLSAGIWLAIFRGAPHRPAKIDIAGAMVLIWVVLAVATGFSAPGMSYLFAWPALVGSLILVALPARQRFRMWIPGMIAFPTLVLVVPAMYVFFQMALPRPGNTDSQMVEVMAVVILLATLVGGLVASVSHRSSKTVMTPE